MSFPSTCVGMPREPSLDDVFKEMSEIWGQIDDLLARINDLENDNGILTLKLDKLNKENTNLTMKVAQLEELVYIPPSQSGYMEDPVSMPSVIETVAAPAQQ